MRLPQHLKLPYDEISRMLEKIPGGLTFDQLSSKLFCLKRLKKKDVDTLLQYCRERDRIEVRSILRKGMETSPLLRHRKHLDTTVEVTEQVPEVATNVVHIAHMGRPDIKPASKEIQVMTTETQSLSEKEAFMAERPHLSDVAKAILNGLKDYPNGLTRSELRNIAPMYHRLRGDNRNDVIAYLVKFEGVREINSENRVRGARLYYPGHYEALTGSRNTESSIDLFNQHAAQFDDTDDADDLDENDNVGNLLRPGEEPRYQGVVSAETIREKIVTLLKERGEEIAMADLYELIPEYGSLGEDARRNCLRDLVESRVISMGRLSAPYTRGAGVMKIWLYEGKEGTVVHQQTDKNVGAQSAMALALQQAMAGSKKPIVAPAKVHASVSDTLTVTPTPVTEQPQVRGVAFAEPTIPTPVTETATETEAVPVPVATPTSQTAADIRAQIQHLEAVARRLESQERDDAVREAILPLRNELQSEYKRLETAVTEQIDALAAMGNILGRIDTVLGEK